MELTLVRSTKQIIDEAMRIDTDITVHQQIISDMLNGSVSDFYINEMRLNLKILGVKKKVYS